MKIKLLYLLCLIASNIAVAQYHTSSVIINDTKVTYDTTKRSLAVYLDSTNQQPNYTKALMGDDLVDATIYEGKLLLQLKVQSVDEFMVLELTNGKIIDYFWAIFSNISPNGRFIIFTQYIPRRTKSDKGWQSGITALYDLALSPRKNRNKATLEKMKNKDFSKLNYDAGIPIYPTLNKNASHYGWITRKEDSHKSSGAYWWISNNEVLFALQAIKNSSTLIQININENGRHEVNQYDISILNQIGNKQTYQSVINIKNIEKQDDVIQIETSGYIKLRTELSKLPKVKQIK